MGLFDFLRRLFFGGQRRAPAVRGKRPRTRPRLVPLRRDAAHARVDRCISKQRTELPYRFARQGVTFTGYLDLSCDGRDERLAEFQLPQFRTPEQLADWLQMPVGQAAWLTHRFTEKSRPENERDAHYHYHWMRKRSSGWRLIESPKRTMKRVQLRILREILDKIPAHAAAHGFVAGRSVLTNAEPHVGQTVLLKLDLENFYANVTFGRVTAIFRSVGYSREAAIWLARLTTSALPPSMPFPQGDASAIVPYLGRHLPQGGPTSPGLANLSAFSLDVRLSGLARSFGAGYTRYADDLTFSGPEGFIGSLADFIPLVTQVIRSERFRVNRRKRKVIRDNARQVVTGVVVNERTNISRAQYDRLKAILTNCIRLGPSSQNRDNHDDYAAHLRGRVAHVMQLNRTRGAKLLALYQQISWKRP